MSPTGNRGFTLLELLVALTIAAGVMTLALAQYSGLSALVALKSSARELASALRLARSDAVTQHREVALVLDVKHRSYRAGARSRPLPPGLELELVAAHSEAVAQGAAAIRFYPDGSSTGGRVTLSAARRAYVVEVDWLTGRVVVHE